MSVAVDCGACIETKAAVTFLTHQIVSLLRALKIQQCGCSSCIGNASTCGLSIRPVYHQAQQQPILLVNQAVANLGNCVENFGTQRTSTPNKNQNFAQTKNQKDPVFPPNEEEGGYSPLSISENGGSHQNGRSSSSPTTVPEVPKNESGNGNESRNVSRAKQRKAKLPQRSNIPEKQAKIDFQVDFDHHGNEPGENSILSGNGPEEESIFSGIQVKEEFFSSDEDETTTELKKFSKNDQEKRDKDSEDLFSPQNFNLQLYTTDGMPREKPRVIRNEEDIFYPERYTSRVNDFSSQPTSTKKLQQELEDSLRPVFEIPPSPPHLKGAKLWQMLIEMLENPQKYGDYMSWTEKETGIFKLHNSDAVAKMWGKVKNRQGMTYEKMSRILRYYYKKGFMEKVKNATKTYRFVRTPGLGNSFDDSEEFSFDPEEK